MIRIENCTLVGQITKFHGLRGNVVVQSGDFLFEEFESEPIFLLLGGGLVPFFITPDSVKQRGSASYLVHFDDVDTQEQAEQLVGCDVYVDSSLIESEEETFDDDDLQHFVGFSVTDEESGVKGVVTDVADYSGNIVFSIDIEGKEVLLPLGEHFIKMVDEELKSLSVFIPKDLLDLN